MFLMRLECTFLPKSLVLSPAIIEGVQVCVIQMFTVGFCIQIGDKDRLPFVSGRFDQPPAVQEPTCCFLGAPIV